MIHKGPILIVEDDAVTRVMMSEYLAQERYFVAEAASGEEALERCHRNAFEVILLDILLPGQDGLSLIAELRRLNPRVGIILVSSKGEALDRVIGLEMGADDYIAKPLDLREMLARVRALMRRHSLSGQLDETRLRFGDWCLDLGARTLTGADGAAQSLPDGEFRVLRELTVQAGRVVPRGQLLDILRGDGEPASSRSLDVILSRIRSKFGENEGHRLISTIHGVGYRFDGAIE